MIKMKDLIPRETVLIHKQTGHKSLVLAKQDLVTWLSEPDSFLDCMGGYTIEEINESMTMDKSEPWHNITEEEFPALYGKKVWFWNNFPVEKAQQHILRGFYPDRTQPYASDMSWFSYASVTKPTTV